MNATTPWSPPPAPDPDVDAPRITAGAVGFGVLTLVFLASAVGGGGGLKGSVVLSILAGLAFLAAGFGFTGLRTSSSRIAGALTIATAAGILGTTALGASGLLPGKAGLALGLGTLFCLAISSALLSIASFANMRRLTPVAIAPGLAWAGSAIFTAGSALTVFRFLSGERPTSSGTSSLETLLMVASPALTAVSLVVALVVARRPTQRA